MSFADLTLHSHSHSHSQSERTYLLEGRQADMGVGAPSFDALRRDAQVLASSSLDHQVVDIEQAPLPVVTQAAQTDSVWTKAWNNLGCFKFVAFTGIGTLFFLVYVGYLYFSGDNTPSQPSTHVSESIARRPVTQRRVEESVKPPKLTSRRPVLVDPYDAGIHFPSPDGSHIRAREVRERTIAGAQETLDHFEEDIGVVATSLQLAAAGSGISHQAFKEALIARTPLEEVGIKYYRLVPGKNEIPRSQKDKIESHYLNGQHTIQRWAEAKEAKASSREEILSHYSTSQEFNDALLDGLPYELSIQGDAVDVRQHRALGGFRIINRHAMSGLVLQLGRWASGQDGIQLDRDDLGFRTQHYLVKLAQDMPMTLTRDEMRGLEANGLELQPSRRGDRQVSLERSDAGPVIRATREMALVDKSSAEVRGYLQWDETVNISTGELTRHVTEK